ncbi:PTS transporter subunit EIIC [Malacoplasma iowae]|uniref:PTS transporter subunit EIIC n=1 Tax=Malacoplasma iowae TaxID=2116 RepID=UPI003872F1D5|nr:PTS transporter subunit EIIC [Malacoplasma iowae]
MKSIFKPTQYELTYKTPLTGKLKQLGNKTDSSKKFLAKVRKFGSFMAGMVIPAIGVLIAWGLFTAIILGVKTGIAYQHNIAIDKWTSSDSSKYLFNMDKVIDLGIQFTIPLIIAFLGGRQIYDWRGALVGFASVIGVIAYSQISLQSNISNINELTHKWTFNAIMVQITGDVKLINTGASPMILGALISGPLFAWLFKNFEKLYKNHIKQGFEMLVNNFSLGIFGCAAIIVCFWGIGPLMAVLQVVFFFIIQGINNAGLLFVLPIFVEFEKILFLNNAVNHGILGPLGYQAVTSVGYSPLFFLDPNPGQGLGLLLAYICFGTKEQKSQATAATPIHFVGGIHEVYYPFVLMKPINLLFMMAGGVFAGAIYQIFNFGGIFTPSPGSVIMNYLAVYSAKPLNYLALTIAIFGAAAIVFALTSLSLLWVNIRNGQRIVLNPLKIKLISNIYKSKEFDSIKDINITKKIKDVKYENVKDKNNFLWEIVTLKDGSQEFYPIKEKDKKIESVSYKIYDKDENKKEKYCEKFYYKESFDLSTVKNKRDKLTNKLNLKIDQLNKKHDEKIKEINLWKETIDSKLNPMDTFSKENLEKDFKLKVSNESFKYNKKLDLLKFKIVKNNFYDAKRIKVSLEESEIDSINYEQKQIEFLKRTIVFENNLEQKKIDKQKIKELKKEYLNNIKNLNESDNVKIKIEKDKLKKELNNKINALIKIDADGKLIKKQYFKNDVKLIDVDSKQENINDFLNVKELKDQLSNNDELFNVVKKAKKIIFACEAGMGSSAMGAGMIKKMITSLGVKDIEVTNCAIKDLPNDVDIIVTQKTFKEFVNKNHPNSYVYGINQFLKKDEYKELIDTIKIVKVK